ncbi:hypothetical protein ACFWWM_16335 [Streptomyces sp. NPDC058682]|uniref:hypothetical protein n=1 Tax=Streptomyces sp. NPDC058682 TaxID=3346596 RepID=UPI00365C87BC
MDTALGTILTGFRYPTRRRLHFRLGHIIGQPPTLRSNPVHDRDETPLPATDH